VVLGCATSSIKAVASRDGTGCAVADVDTSASQNLTGRGIPRQHRSKNRAYWGNPACEPRLGRSVSSPTLVQPVSSLTATHWLAPGLAEVKGKLTATAKGGAGGSDAAGRQNVTVEVGNRVNSPSI